ncbi:glycoside hydrolase family 13 protein [Geopyxis carbonaria]|nr:glycoside hydrolase family 13 protein [Geopyxis carbonaria]
MRAKRRWWKEASIYQIYPSSFKDSNDDGIGDIPGINSKLDYLKELGVDIVWLSPVYKSPGKDMGYDISDYRAINPIYGTMEDADNLIKGLHDRGMKLVMDLVVNHTSDQHDWFIESRSSKTNPKRDWYVWKDPKYDENGNRQPPNNWGSVFGGPAWSYDEATGQYYLHCFAPEQPDLDWNHDPVREAVHDLMKFWLDKSVDGFRMDVINMISKTPGLPDAPVVFPDQPWQPADQLFINGPRLHEFLKDLREKVLSKYDIMTVGEMPWLKDRDEVLKVVGADRGELDMIFQFDLINMDFGKDGRFTSPNKPWDLHQLKAILEDWQLFMIENSGWNSVCIESHDQPRSVTRFIGREITDNNDINRLRAAKMLATLEAGQSGTIFVYQGQELGMKNIPLDWPISEYKDFETQNRYKEALKLANGDESKIQDLMQQIHLKARDHARTPIQWDASPHGGFTTGTPWMRVNDDYRAWNAAKQIPNDDSILSYWKSILKVRKLHKDVFIYGDFELLSREHDKVVAYRRFYEKQQALILLNFSNTPTEWTVPKGREGEIQSLFNDAQVLLKNYDDVQIDGCLAKLREFEAIVFYA